MDYKVAVIICTYNPEWDKLKVTIDSCLCQKDINFQIVITDDCSRNNFFTEIKDYFCKNNFDDYVLVAADKNQGTVLNLYNGLKASSAMYVKCISPGDYMCSEYVLKDWLNRLLESGRSWSFGKAIYFNIENAKRRNVSVKSHPQIIKPYMLNNDKICRWNYIVLKDIALGATMLSKRDITLKYLEKIVGKIKYAEDNIWRLMMFDGIVPYYHDVNVIYYEYGTGISTSNSSKWKKVLDDEWCITDRIICESNCDEKLKYKMVKKLNENKRTLLSKISSLLFTKGKLLYVVHCKLLPTMTDMEVKDNAGC